MSAPIVAPSAESDRVSVILPGGLTVSLVLLPTRPRLDRVDRVDWRPRTGEVRVITGTPGSGGPPAAADGWEPVALIRRPRGSLMVTGSQIDHVVPAGPVVSRTYRTGRRNGRNLYAQVGPEPSGQDVPVGMLDTPELARFAAEAMNAALVREREMPDQKT